jgi:hypothetical protein
MAETGQSFIVNRSVNPELKKSSVSETFSAPLLFSGDGDGKGLRNVVHLQLQRNVASHAEYHVTFYVRA